MRTYCSAGNTAPRERFFRSGARIVRRLVIILLALVVQPPSGGVAQDVFSSGGSGGSAGRGTYPTGTQSHQPNDAPCGNPFGCGRGTGLSGAIGALGGVIGLLNGAINGGAANPAGRDVYCQQSPGQPMYGPYHGTGTQTPCGPNFQRGQPQPSPPPQPASTVPCSKDTGWLERPNDGDSLIRRAGTKYPPFVLLAKWTQAAGGLTVGGKKIDPNSDKDYNCTIKFLTVPDSRQKGSLFNSSDTAAIKQNLEDPLRRQIFDAMANNPVAFRFKSVDSANQNINIRVEAIRFMRGIQGLNLTCGFTGGRPFIISPFWTAEPPSLTAKQISQGWTAPAGLVLNSSAYAGAHAAIAEFRSTTSRLDCLGGIEMTIFEAVDKIIGAEAFNAEHAEGLRNIGLNVPSPPSDSSDDDAPTSSGAWNGISIFANVRVFLSPTFEMMVPGDWAYMRNDPNYRGGAWTGENTIYMGKYINIGGGNAVYLKPSDSGYEGSYFARYSGLGGESDKTAGQLANDLERNFQGPTGVKPDPSKIGWTMLARVKAGSR